MEFDLDKLDHALATWIGIHQRVDTLDQRASDLFVDANRFMLNEDDTNTENLKYLKKVGEYVLECAEQEEDKYWVSEVKKTLDDIDNMASYIGQLKKEIIVKPIHRKEDTDWNTVIALIDRMKIASHRIERLASIGFMLYQRMGGDL